MRHVANLYRGHTTLCPLPTTHCPLPSALSPLLSALCLLPFALPYLLSRQVLNVAIRVDQRCPVSCAARLIDQPVVVLRSLRLAPPPPPSPLSPLSPPPSPFAHHPGGFAGADSNDNLYNELEFEVSDRGSGGGSPRRRSGCGSGKGQGPSPHSRWVDGQMPRATPVRGCSSCIPRNINYQPPT